MAAAARPAGPARPRLVARNRGDACRRHSGCGQWGRRRAGRVWSWGAPPSSCSSGARSKSRKSGSGGVPGGRRGPLQPSGGRVRGKGRPHQPRQPSSSLWGVSGGPAPTCPSSAASAREGASGNPQRPQQPPAVPRLAQRRPRERGAAADRPQQPGGGRGGRGGRGEPFPSAAAAPSASRCGGSGWLPAWEAGGGDGMIRDLAPATLVRRGARRACPQRRLPGVAPRRPSGGGRYARPSWLRGGGWR